MKKTAKLRETLDQYIKLHPETLDSYLGTETGVFIREPNINCQMTMILEKENGIFKQWKIREKPLFPLLMWMQLQMKW